VQQVDTKVEAVSSTEATKYAEDWFLATKDFVQIALSKGSNSKKGIVTHARCPFSKGELLL
jgi:hypothetical protein